MGGQIPEVVRIDQSNNRRGGVSSVVFIFVYLFWVLFFVFCFFLFLLNWSEQQQGQCVISGDVEVISGGGGGEFT